MIWTRKIQYWFLGFRVLGVWKRHQSKVPLQDSQNPWLKFPYVFWEIQRHKMPRGSSLQFVRNRQKKVAVKNLCVCVVLDHSFLPSARQIFRKHVEICSWTLAVFWDIEASKSCPCPKAYGLMLLIWIKSGSSPSSYSSSSCSSQAWTTNAECEQILQGSKSGGWNFYEYWTAWSCWIIWSKWSREKHYFQHNSRKRATQFRMCSLGSNWHYKIFIAKKSEIGDWLYDPGMLVVEAHFSSQCLTEQWMNL